MQDVPIQRPVGICHNVRVLFFFFCGKRIWLKKQFSSFMVVTRFHKVLFCFFFFKQLMSAANTESYTRSQVCPRTLLPTFLLVVVSVGPDCQFVCQPNCTWNGRSPQLRSYCVFTENFNKTSLINFCFHSKCWHFFFVIFFFLPCKHM